MYACNEVQIILSPWAAIRAGIQMYRRGLLGWYGALTYRGPVFKNVPGESHLYHFLGGTTVNISVRDLKDRTEVKYVYPLHTLQRVRVS